MYFKEKILKSREVFQKFKSKNIDFRMYFDYQLFKFSNSSKLNFPHTVIEKLL